MLVGSAPCFPFGLIDPIPELGAVAEQHGLWLHVDACVGGYLAPFVRMNGTALTDWDFAVPAVRSISADLHKYGYASKGASTVLFRSAALKEHMTFSAGPWPLGRMVTPTLAGIGAGIVGALAAGKLLQKLVFGGCHVTRRIGQLISGSGLEVTELENYYRPGSAATGYTYEGQARKTG